MYREEKKHSIKPRCFGLRDKNHRKVGDLFPLWASVNVSLHVCFWSLAVVCPTGLEELQKWK